VFLGQNRLPVLDFVYLRMLPVAIVMFHRGWNYYAECVIHYHACDFIILM